MGQDPKNDLSVSLKEVMLPCIFENCNYSSLILCMIAVPNE